MARGGKLVHATRKASEEREHQIGLQLVGRREEQQQQQQEQQEHQEHQEHQGKTKDIALYATGSYLIDSFLVDLVLSSFDARKYQLMSTTLMTIARRCILLRSKRSISKRKGVRIMIRLMEEKFLGDPTTTTR